MQISQVENKLINHIEKGSRITKKVSPPVTALNNDWINDHNVTVKHV